MGKKIIAIQSKNGTSYLYEDKSYWNKEKGYSTHERKCIGKLTPAGEPVYNEYYQTREKINELTAETEAKNPGTISSTAFVGETLVLDKVSAQTGIVDVLTESFGEGDAKNIIALAYYQVCRGKALSNAGDWLDQRGYGDLRLNSQRVSELLERLKEDKINTFFKGWSKKHAEEGDQLFDITSISTYGFRRRSKVLPLIGQKRYHYLILFLAVLRARLKTAEDFPSGLHYPMVWLFYEKHNPAYVHWTFHPLQFALKVVPFFLAS